MAKIHSKDTVITIGGVDISTYTNASTFTETGDTHDTSGYGQTAKTYVGGMTDGTFSLGGVYDDTATVTPQTVLKGVVGTEVAVIRQAEGAGTGKAQESFSGVVSQYSESAPIADVIQWSAEIQISGAITDTAQA